MYMQETAKTSQTFKLVYSKCIDVRDTRSFRSHPNFVAHNHFAVTRFARLSSLDGLESLRPIGSLTR